MGIEVYQKRIYKIVSERPGCYFTKSGNRMLNYDDVLHNLPIFANPSNLAFGRGYEMSGQRNLNMPVASTLSVSNYYSSPDIFN